MSSLGGKKIIGRLQKSLQLHDRKTLSDYVTAVAWSPNGEFLAASSAIGEVVLWQQPNSISILRSPTGLSVNCLSFSKDNQLLAAGGQDGKVNIWHLPNRELITTLENSPAWIDRLAWSPNCNQLAISLGRQVSIWDADSKTIVATLNFEASSVLDIDWRPDGNYLAISGYQGTKIWHASNWNEEPEILDTPSASVAIAWSKCGNYIAQGNLDNSLTVLQWQNPHPWLMRGFPGKVRALAWPDRHTPLQNPLLASASADAVVIWEKQPQDVQGWSGWMLEEHLGIVVALAFQPGTFLLASAGEDGVVCLWHSAQKLVQILSGAPDGFSCLAWQPTGRLLAAGGQNGELLIWTKSMQGKGFK